MHSYLLTGSDRAKINAYQESLLSKWRIHKADIYTVTSSEGGTIGIAQIRIFISKMMYKPQLSPFQIGIIDSAEKLTAEAQNALLKLLEEPPPQTKILLLADSIFNILPTVHSRCEIITLSTRAEVRDKLNPISDILHKPGLSRGELMNSADKITATREELIGYLDQYILNACSDKSDLKIIPVLKKCLKIKRLLQYNLNTKLLLDYLWFGANFELDKIIDLV